MVIFFILLPLDSQLRELFENSNMSDLVHYRFSRTKTEINNIEDIYDGAS